jgi:hypothetical protein
MRFEGQKLSRLRIERVEQSLRLFEVGRVEAFGEPTMDRRENIACFGSLALGQKRARLREIGCRPS